MNSSTQSPEEDVAPLLDRTLERKRLSRDGALRRRLADHLIPGLPVDGDARFDALADRLEEYCGDR